MIRNYINNIQKEESNDHKILERVCFGEEMKKRYVPKKSKQSNPFIKRNDM